MIYSIPWQICHDHNGLNEWDFTNEKSDWHLPTNSWIIFGIMNQNYDIMKSKQQTFGFNGVEWDLTMTHDLLSSPFT